MTTGPYARDETESDVPSSGLAILSLSLVYPNPLEPGLGLFVRSRLQNMAALAGVEVIAPVPVLDYSSPTRKLWPNGIPSHRMDTNVVTVRHPRWIYPPGGTPANVLCLFLRLIWPLARLRQTFRFQVIDAHFGYPEGVVAALLAGIFGCPFLVTLRGSEPIFARYRYRRLCLKWALRRASAVITVSEALRDFAKELGAEPSRVKTIPNGIDESVFFPRQRVTCRLKYGIAPDTHAIVCAGELIEAKGHHLVIRVVNELTKGGMNVELFIAGGVARGGAPFDTEIRQLISELGMDTRIHLLGWVNQEDLAELMTAADVFCLASFTEGWPNVVNEALACGAPVVASNVGAVPHMIPTNEYGYVVPAKDPVALYDALKAVLLREWNRAEIAEWGRSRSWDQVGREAVTLIRQVMSEAYVRN